MLFRKSRPHIRKLEKSDLGWLWAAYKAGSFGLKDGLEQAEFTQEIVNALAGRVNYVVEDDNRKFSSGRGPVAVVGMLTNGFCVEPSVSVFKWATRRNLLRGFVAFFQWVKYSPEIGMCEVKYPSRESKLLLKMADYGVLFPKDRLTVFRISGRKKDNAWQR